MNLSKKIKGDIAELAVAKRLMLEGWQILFPYGEDHRYDLVVEKDGKFIKIQVKYITPKNGAIDINCQSSNNWSVLVYNPSEIDVIAAYNSTDEEIYFLPASKMHHRSFKLRLEDAKNNQKSKINLAKNFSKFKL
jgi:hypothetical protein